MEKSYAHPERREYPRLEEEIPLIYEAPQTSEIKTSFARNISGGGICLRMQTGLGSGCLLSLNFDLPGHSIKNVQASVINYNALDKNNAKTFIHRLKFIDIDTPLQEKIVRFVFEKNRMDSQFRQ